MLPSRVTFDVSICIFLNNCRYSCDTMLDINFGENCEKWRCSCSHKQCKTLLLDLVMFDNFLIYLQRLKTKDL